VSMLRILSVDPASRSAGTPLLDSDGVRVGTVTETADDARYVSVDPNPPPETLEVLGWDADSDRVPLPDRLVATVDDDAVRLVV
jgi:hypothetical protein